MNNNIPVLILIFNRKEPVAALVNSLRKIKPVNIFIASDGPREGMENEVLKIQETREMITKKIDWECKISYLYRDYNLGCKLAVSDAVQWFFSQVQEGIVLEDDCIPTSAFFDYTSDMLEHYRDDKRVATIGGRREVDFQKGKILHSSKFFCWGWASWADRIQGIDVEFGYQRNLPASVFEGVSFFERQHVKGIHNMMLKGVVNSWAYSYDLYFRFKLQIHIVPPINYIKNVGIGTGTHDSSEKDDVMMIGDSWEKVSPPKQVQRSADYMGYYFREVYSIVKLLLFPFVGSLKSFKRKIGL